MAMPAMRSRLISFYPLLFAIFPILSLAADSPGEYRLSDLQVLVLLTLALTAGLQMLLMLVLHRHTSTGLASCIALLVVGWFFYFGPFSQLLIEIGYTLSRPRTLAAGVTLAVIAWLVWARPRLQRFTVFMTLTGSLLVTAASVRIVVHQLSAADLLRRQTARRDATSALAVVHRSASTKHLPSRDIYLLVLDGYASGAVLEKSYHFSNRAFEDSLRALGFTIPRSVQSNYVQTQLSLTSLLNFDHVRPLTVGLGREKRAATVLRRLIESNRLVEFLKREEYTFVFVPSSWYGTQGNHNANVTLRPWRGFSLGRELSRTPLRRALQQSSLLNLLVHNMASQAEADYLLRSFRAISSVPRMTKPTFLFAHVLMPHPPYVLDAECHPVDSGTKLTQDEDQWANRKGYLGQIQCVNRLVLELVREIIRHSPVSPIVVLQGDHGPAIRDQVGRPTAWAVSASEAAERFGTFGAYYVPGGADTAFAGRVTPVNVFRRILRYYFGAELPDVRDALYFSVWDRPYDFVEFEVTGGGYMAGPLRRPIR